MVWGVVWVRRGRPKREWDRARGVCELSLGSGFGLDGAANVDRRPVSIHNGSISKIMPHIVLPTEDLPQQLDDEGYLLDEDGQLVYEEVPIDGQDQESTSEKVGPLQDIPSS